MVGVQLESDNAGEATRDAVNDKEDEVGKAPAKHVGHGDGDWKKEGTDSVGATETKDDSASPAVPAKATASTDILDPEPSAPQLVVTPDTPALLSVEDEDSKRIGQDGITGRTVEITQ